jgi:hypothetical protein
MMGDGTDLLEKRKKIPIPGTEPSIYASSEDANQGRVTANGRRERKIIHLAFSRKLPKTPSFITFFVRESPSTISVSPSRVLNIEILVEMERNFC